ncbi:MAG TPA: PEGA domain-containing protein, partial [Deltaproteobacteria bacterium]|nr:PEGA domain-containing protein [Deltaproteobacteria bacterium]
PVVVEVAPPPPESDFGTVVIKDANGYNADVYLRGKRIGQTHSDLILQVGDHELQLRSRLLFDETLRVTVSPGEKQVVNVLLKVRPTRVVFPGGWDGDCRVIATDATHHSEDVGSLSQLGWSWQIDHPDKRVELQLSCNGKPVASKIWRVMSSPEVRFPDVPGRP